MSTRNRSNTLSTRQDKEQNNQKIDVREVNLSG